MKKHFVSATGVLACILAVTAAWLLVEQYPGLAFARAQGIIKTGNCNMSAAAFLCSTAASHVHSAVLACLTSAQAGCSGGRSHRGRRTAIREP